MSMRPVRAIASHDLRLMRHDPEVIVLLLVIPILVMLVIKSTSRATLVAEHFIGANGSEQAVPGMAVLFASFIVGMTSVNYMREYVWGTWPRVMAYPARLESVLLGKALPGVVLCGVQLTCLFAFGALFVGLDVKGSIPALALVAGAYCVCLVALGTLLASVARTVQQSAALSNFGALLMGGLGGALVPVASLPSWSRSVAPIMPAYWAMRGFRRIVLFDGGIGSVYVDALVLLGVATLAGVVAVARFHATDKRIDVTG